MSVIKHLRFLLHSLFQVVGCYSIVTCTVHHQLSLPTTCYWGGGTVKLLSCTPDYEQSRVQGYYAKLKLPGRCKRFSEFEMHVFVNFWVPFDSIQNNGKNGDLKNITACAME